MLVVPIKMFWVIRYCFKFAKLFFWESRTVIRTLQKLSGYIGISYRFVLNSVKKQNRIFFVMDSSFKVLQCQIWLTNEKLSFWESKTNIGTLQKTLSSYWVSYKSILKSGKCINWIFWVIEYLFSSLEYQIWLTSTKPFF